MLLSDIGCGTRGPSPTRLWPSFRLDLRSILTGEGTMRRGLLLLLCASFIGAGSALGLLWFSISYLEADLTQPAAREWLAPGGDLHNTRYSILDKLTPANVKQLKAAWVVHLGSGLGAKYSLETTPIVKDGVMYVTSGNDDVLALD